ncbi:MAG TPA: ATP-binding protein [Chitinophagaceae bacterium]|nr:ATP-binding protein [Chitinophagaceae bacterium]
MRKNILFYGLASVLLVIVLLFFNAAYKELTNYSELINRQNVVHICYQELSRQMNNAAMLTPELAAANSPVADEIFFADSASIIHRLELLNATVRDSINVRIAHALDSLVRAELPWILQSNVPDSILNNASSAHSAAFRYINRLINDGIQRTMFIVDHLKIQLNKEITKIRIWMGLFVFLSGMLLVYTTTSLFKQKAKVKRKDRQLQVQSRIAAERLVKSETLYKTIASSIPDSVICLFDHDYRYLLIEGDMLERLGYTKEELLGKRAADVLSPERFAEVEPDFKRAFQGESVIREVRMAGYDIYSKYIPLKDDNQSVYAIMTVALDITKLKNAQRDITELNRGLEEKVKERTEELRKSNEELEAFSYSVSHDLRAPLRAIAGFIGILEEDYADKLDGEAQRITTIIRNNTLKMGHLIDDLLAFFRIGKKEMFKAPIKTREMVDEAIAELMEQNTNDKPPQWDIKPLPSVRGDANSIKQVWVNLISNAIKYSANAPQPRIEIGSYTKNSEVVFYVKDNGVGFDEKYSNKLFKVFQRLHSSNEFEGTGIGLALVEKIVAKHGGRVWAEGSINEGACFYFSLPG